MRSVVLGERPPELEEFLERRRALGQDGYDEVWEGEHHAAPGAPVARRGPGPDALTADPRERRVRLWERAGEGFPEVPTSTFWT